MNAIEQVYIGRIPIVSTNDAIKLFKDRNFLELRANSKGHFKIIEPETFKTIAYINEDTYYEVESSLMRLHYKTMFQKYWQWAHEQTRKSSIYLNWLMHWKFKEDDWSENYVH